MSADSNFTYPTQFKIKKIDVKLEGEAVSLVPLLVQMEIFENIYLGGVTGSITIMDTDAASFIEEQKIEFVEEFEFEIEDTQGESLQFQGHLNGIRNEVQKQQRKTYAIDFNSTAVRMNEMGGFITKRYKGVPPEQIAQEICDKLETELDAKGQGEPMHFLGSRKKPLDIMKYVLTHAVTSNSSADDKPDEVEQKASGTTGFLFWETVDGYRFAATDDLIKGDLYETHDNFKLQTAQKSLPMQEAVKCIIDYSFPQITDFQSKLRSGAYKSKHVSFDVHSGEYREYTYEAEAGQKEKGSTTQKQIDLVKNPTRIVYKLFNNERAEETCTKAQTDKYDQSRKTVQQSISRQNAAVDQHGRITLAPSYKIRAGDTLKIVVNKISSDDSPTQESKKHSGTYIVKQVSHTIGKNGNGYTQVSTIRSVTQQDQETS